MATVKRNEVQQEIVKVTNLVVMDLNAGYIEAEVNGLVPAIVVGRVSARRWFVGWTCQPKTAQPGDIAKVAHPEEFIEAPHIHNILVDELWHMLHFS